MSYLILVLLGIPSSLIWVINAEALAMLAGLADGPLWPLVGLSLACGQCLGYTALFHGGEAVTQRIAPLRRKLEALRRDPARLERYGRNAELWLVISAVLGFPPCSVMTVLARAMGVSSRRFVVTVLLGRWLRFAVLAYAPELFSGWLTPGSAPAWLTGLW